MINNLQAEKNILFTENKLLKKLIENIINSNKEIKLKFEELKEKYKNSETWKIFYELNYEKMARYKQCQIEINTFEFISTMLDNYRWIIPNGNLYFRTRYNHKHEYNEKGKSGIYCPKNASLCTTCGHVLPLEEFGQMFPNEESSSSNRRHVCRKCISKNPRPIATREEALLEKQKEINSKYICDKLIIDQLIQSSEQEMKNIELELSINFAKIEKLIEKIE